MRKILGPVLLGLGGFLLVIAVLALVWAPGVVKKTPIDVNQTTQLSGIVKKLDPATGELVENPVKIQSISRTDSDASDDDTVVWFQTACVVIDIDDAPDCVDGDDERLVSASTSTFATDRVTALAVSDFKGLPSGTPPREGLQNKWPFDSEKKTYPFWDDTTGTALDAVYDRTETLLGVECYVYSASVEDAPIEIGEGIPGTYTNAVEVWVEPKTGAIQQQTQDQQRYLADGTQVLDLKVGFTEAQQKAFADDSKANVRLLDLMLVWIPIIGFVVGGLCLVAGVLLFLGRRRSNGAPADDNQLVGSSA
ncbi:DUF3068 domain-containing protein [soil metagenome]